MSSRGPMIAMMGMAMMGGLAWWLWDSCKLGSLGFAPDKCPRHTECSAGKCSIVYTEGVNQCSSDVQCAGCATQGQTPGNLGCCNGLDVCNDGICRVDCSTDGNGILPTSECVQFYGRIGDKPNVLQRCCDSTGRLLRADEARIWPQVGSEQHCYPAFGDSGQPGRKTYGSPNHGTQNFDYTLYLRSDEQPVYVGNVVSFTINWDAMNLPQGQWCSADIGVWIIEMNGSMTPYYGPFNIPGGEMVNNPGYIEVQSPKSYVVRPIKGFRVHTVLNIGGALFCLGGWNRYSALRSVEVTFA